MSQSPRARSSGPLDSPGSSRGKSLTDLKLDIGDGEEEERLVIREGVLSKKQARGLPGFRGWNSRYFVITKWTSGEIVMCYWKDEDSYKQDCEEGKLNPMRLVRFENIYGIELLPKRRLGNRFDVRCSNKKVYALDAATPKQAKKWVGAFRRGQKLNKEFTVSKKAAEADKGKEGWTKFQKVFLELKHPKHEQRNPEVVAKLAEEFPDDKSILEFLLNTVIDVADTLKPTKEELAEEEGEEESESEDEKEGDAKEREEERKAARLTELVKSGLHRLAENIKTPKFFRAVGSLFGLHPEDYDIQDLAMRTLWITLHLAHTPKVAAREFSDSVKVFCSEERFNTTLKNTLFSLLYQDFAGVISEVGKEQKVSFYKPYKSPKLVPAVFNILNGSPYEARLRVLEDYNTSLIGAPANCVALTSLDQWAHLVLGLLTDIPRSLSNPESKEDSESLQKIYMFVMNIFAVIHTEFFTEDYFCEMLSETYDSVISFTGASADAANTFGTILRICVNKLKSTAGMKAFREEDTTLTTWQNITAFYQLVLVFVFRTSDLKTSKSKFIEKDTSVMGSEEKARYLKALKMRRMHDESGDTEMIIRKVRTNAEELAAFPSLMESKSFGLHFKEDGAPGDLQLMQSLLAMYKSLKFDDFDEVSFRGNSTDAAYRKARLKEYQFLDQAVKLLKVVHRKGIDKGYMTWRYVAASCRRFSDASDKKTRRGIINDIKEVVAGNKSM